MARLSYTDNLSPHITYLMDKNKYLNGGGLGNFAIAEVYLYGGIIFVALIYFLFGYFLASLETKAEKNIFVLVFVGIFSNLILTQPRGSFFPLINIIIFIVFMLFFIKKIRF